MTGLVKSPFAIIPWQVAADKRLTSRHMRVLIALLSFRSQDTGPFWATREQIRERSGLPITRISTVTTELEAYGWLKKIGSGHVATRYIFTVPTVTETVTVTEVVTVTNPVTPTVPILVTQQLPTGVTLLDPTETHTETQECLPEWLDGAAWTAWIIYRKELGKKLTKSTVTRQIKFLDSHRADHPAIIEQSIRAGWTGLFALKDKTHGTEKPRNLSAVERVRIATAKRDAELDAQDDVRDMAQDDGDLRPQVGQRLRGNGRG